MLFATDSRASLVYANEDSGIGTLNERSGDATAPESDDIDSIMDELLRQENRRRSDDLRDLVRGVSDLHAISCS